MNIRDWVKGLARNPGDASGNRINDSIKNHDRIIYGLPPQKKACFIDLDGIKRYYDLNVQKDGSPSLKVKITLHRYDGETEHKLYGYYKEEDGYLVYEECKGLD